MQCNIQVDGVRKSSLLHPQLDNEHTFPNFSNLAGSCPARRLRMH
jgi:hypothetical protein